MNQAGMTKQLIIKFISGKATESEQQSVLEWVAIDKENLKYFTTLKTLWVSQNMPHSKASATEINQIKNRTKLSSNRDKTISFKSIAKYSIAASIIVLLGLNLTFLIQRNNSEKNTDNERILLSYLPEEYKHTLYTNNGVKGYLRLPDGSQVWLNSASKIEYPDKFTGSTREIEISGEAFFDVISNPQMPMVVSTNKDFRVEVLGTKFNIRSYDNDNEAQTTLYSGAITLTRKLKNSNVEIITRLNPEESFIIRSAQAPLYIKQADTTKQKAWKDGKLLFESTPMSEVIKKLERWHGTEFEIEDEEILNYKITAVFKSESIIQIMELIQFSSFVDYTLNGNKVTLKKRASA